MILDKKLNKRIYDNKIPGKKFEEMIDDYSDYEIDQLTKPTDSDEENDSMSNGTRTSSLITHYLQGGWDNTRIAFIHNPETSKVMIRHLADRKDPTSHVPNFHVTIDGKVTVIYANDWYDADFGRIVWNLFIAIKPKGSNSPWTRVA